MNPREETVKVHTSRGCEEVRVVPEIPQGEIHIFKSACGYKLSIDDRHLTLAELTYVVDKINAIYRYGD